MTEAATAALGKVRDRVLAVSSLARGSDAREKLMNKLLSNQTSTRPLSRRKRVKFATTGSPSTMDTGITFNPRPYDPVASADKPQQTEDDGILQIHQVALEFDGDLKLNTLKELRNKYAIKIHYEGDKKTVTKPLADVMEAGNIYGADAGVDNNTNPNEAVVAGTHKIVRPPAALLNLVEDEIMEIHPGESNARIELVLLPEYTAVPTLAGETETLYFYATFRGERIASKHENL
jgi:hypothetical protein